MSGKHISKQEIKAYIKYCEKKLKEMEEDTIKMQNENEKSKQILNDLTERYLDEENLRGQIKAANYILHCC